MDGEAWLHTCPHFKQLRSTLASADYGNDGPQCQPTGKKSLSSLPLRAPLSSGMKRVAGRVCSARASKKRRGIQTPSLSRGFPKALKNSFGVLRCLDGLAPKPSSQCPGPSLRPRPHRPGCSRWVRRSFRLSVQPQTLASFRELQRGGGVGIRVAGLTGHLQRASSSLFNKGGSRSQSP